MIPVHLLHEDDLDSHTDFAETVIKMCSRNPNLYSKIFFFRQNNVISSWRSLKVNVRYWLQENVHWTLKIRPQNLQKINLCVGIVEDPVPFNVPCLTYLACAMPKLQPL